MTQKRKFLFIILLFFLTVMVLADWLVGLAIFKKDTPYLGIREYLRHDHPSPYTAVPFLNYINNPESIADDGSHQINDLGIRHPQHVAIPKPPGTLRVLFLGGSTTFGEVDRTEETFPALLQKQISDSPGIYSPRYDHVECLNTGLGAGTSAEVIVHYLFRYKYLDPDIVVIHMGINDAFTTPKLDNYVYQPDYHTSKRIMENIVAPSPMMKILSHSNIASYIMIHRYYERQLKSDYITNDFFEYHKRNVWFPSGNDSIFSPRYNAFYNNLTELIKSARSGGKKVLLVTEVVDDSQMPKQLQAMLLAGIAQNKAFMIRAGLEQNVPVCILNPAEFSKKYFLPDGIHLNKEGEQLAAEKIKPYLVSLISEAK